jgi:hypothetical protein
MGEIEPKFVTGDLDNDETGASEVRLEVITNDMCAINQQADELTRNHQDSTISWMREVSMVMGDESEVQLVFTNGRTRDDDYVRLIHDYPKPLPNGSKGKITLNWDPTDPTNLSKQWVKSEVTSPILGESEENPVSIERTRTGFNERDIVIIRKRLAELQDSEE